MLTAKSIMIVRKLVFATVIPSIFVSDVQLQKGPAGLVANVQKPVFPMSNIPVQNSQKHLMFATDAKNAINVVWKKHSTELLMHRWNTVLSNQNSIPALPFPKPN